MLNVSLVFLSSALAVGSDAAAPPVPAVLAAAPVTVTGSGCTGCGSPSVVHNTWAPAVYSPMPSACDSTLACGPRVGLFARLRARLASLRPTRTQCAPACGTPIFSGCAAPVVTACAAPVTCASAVPACGRPLFTGFTTSCGDPCQRSGLLDRLRARFSGLRSCDVCAAPQPAASISCSAGGYVTAPAGCSPSYGTIAPAPPGYSPAPTTPAAMPSPFTPAPEKKDEPKKDEPKKNLSVSVPLPSVPTPSVNETRTPVLGGTTAKY